MKQSLKKRMCYQFLDKMAAEYQANNFPELKDKKQLRKSITQNDPPESSKQRQKQTCQRCFGTVHPPTEVLGQQYAKAPCV